MGESRVETPLRAAAGRPPSVIVAATSSQALMRGRAWTRERVCVVEKAGVPPPNQPPGTAGVTTS